MRCPKCGYISFDHLKSCRKCSKDISGMVEELEGVVFEAIPPLFLTLESEEARAETKEDDYLAGAENLAGEEDVVEMSFDAEDDREIVMDLGDDGDDEELSINFDEFEDVSQDNEIALAFDDDEKEVAGAKDEGLPLDFGEIDISDLAPPEEGAGESVAESLSLDEAVAPEVALVGGPPVAHAPAALGGGLEDLQVEDLDLDAAAPLVTGSKTGDKFMPSVKTGTALDDFEIDLGDLTLDEK